MGFKLKLGVTEVFSVEKIKFYLGELLGSVMYLFIAIAIECSSYAVVNSGVNATFVLSISLGFGISYMIVTHVLSRYSEGYMNPAITLSLMIFGKIDILVGLLYMVCQFTGALGGVALCKFLLPAEYMEAILYGLNFPSTLTTDMQAFFLEMCGTAILGVVVFGSYFDVNLNTDESNSNISLKRDRRLFTGGTMNVGFTVFLLHMFLLPFTGCGTNPARSMASAVLAYDFEKVWIYMAGPFAGALAGIVVYHLPMGLEWYLNRKTPPNDIEATAANAQNILSKGSNGKKGNSISSKSQDMTMSMASPSSLRSTKTVGSGKSGSFNSISNDTISINSKASMSSKASMNSKASLNSKGNFNNKAAISKQIHQSNNSATGTPKVSKKSKNSNSKQSSTSGIFGMRMKSSSSIASCHPIHDIDDIESSSSSGSSASANNSMNTSSDHAIVDFSSSTSSHGDERRANDVHRGNFAARPIVHTPKMQRSNSKTRYEY